MKYKIPLIIFLFFLFSIATYAQKSDQDLCVEAVKEVEASRILIKAQAQVIESMTTQAKAYEDYVKAQNELLAEYRRLVEVQKGIQSADAKIAATYEKELANTREQLKITLNKKPSIFGRIVDVAAGVGIGLVLH